MAMVTLELSFENLPPWHCLIVMSCILGVAVFWILVFQDLFLGSADSLIFWTYTIVVFIISGCFGFSGMFSLGTLL